MPEEKFVTIPDLNVMTDWHKGRTPYCVWIYRICDRAVLRSIDELLKPISSLTGILRINNLHMTVFVSGFISEELRHNDDITRLNLEKQIDFVRNIEVPRIRLRISKIDFTEHAIYFVVEESNRFTDNVRRSLQEISPEIRFSDFIPHITLAYYREKIKLRSVAVAINQINKSFSGIDIDDACLELIAINATVPIVPGMGICCDQYETLYSPKSEKSGLKGCGIFARTAA